MAVKRKSVAVLIAVTGVVGCGTDTEPDGGSVASETASESASTSEPPSESPSSSEPTSGDGSYGYDLSDPGDDLLSAVRRGVEFPGGSKHMTWQWPESYDSSSAEEASSSDEQGTYKVSVGAQPGTDVAGAAEKMAQPSGEVHEVTVGDQPFTVVENEFEDGAVRVFLTHPEGDDLHYAVIFLAKVKGEIPEERVEELHQMVGSLEFEAERSGS